MSDNAIDQYRDEIVRAGLENKEDLENFRLKWMSKKGILASLFGRMKDIAPEEKKAWGAQVNVIKQLAEERFEEARVRIEESELRRKKSDTDLTLEAAPLALGARHPLTLMRDRMVDIFNTLGFVISEGPEVVDDWHNFGALNMGPEHPARDMQDTFFLSRNPDIVLRTHTSSVQVKVMQEGRLPIRTISPGRVFRKDNDSTHSPVFHQVEGLYVDEGVSFADLKQTLYYFVQEIFGEGTEVRFRPSYFPFTEPSAEMDIQRKKINPETGEEELSWMEVLGCGMVDPKVLENCGIDSTKYSGFAFGIGIERMAMVRYNIQDIRLFYENDLRFLSQFTYEV